MPSNLPNQNMSFDPFDPLTAAELDDISENIDALAAGTGVDDQSIDQRVVDFADTGADAIWWEELARFEATSLVNDYAVTDIPPRKYIRIMYFHNPSGGVMNGSFFFNGDNSANYAIRYADNGGADGAITSASAIGGIDAGALTANKLYGFFDILNVATMEKQGHGELFESPAGAANVPKHREYIIKWSNMSDQITSIQFIKQTGVAGSIGVGSYCVVLGHN